MGCSQFNDKFEELGVLLKEYEKTIDQISRDQQLIDEQNTNEELTLEGKKERIRIILEDLNKYFYEEPEDFRFNIFKKLNEKFQYLLNEESNVIHEKRDERELISSEMVPKQRYLYT